MVDNRLARALYIAGLASGSAALGGCTTVTDGVTSNSGPPGLSAPVLNPMTQTQHALVWLPHPKERIPVAVYGMDDETGAFKPTEGVQTLTRAVTQGATPILLKALHDAGNRNWFRVIERENLDNLLKERQIILEMRQRYLGERAQDSNALPSLLFAGIIIEGSITGYDSNLVTGGAGARYLGIGASTEYRQDAVSVYLRAVSVKTGEVLLSVNSEQRVASILVQGNAFRFVAFRELLEAETGFTMNQPRHLAVRQAIEKGVYGLIVEGAKHKLWSFQDPEAADAAIKQYNETFAANYSADFAKTLPGSFYSGDTNLSAHTLAGAAEPDPRPVADGDSARLSEPINVAHADVSPSPPPQTDLTTPAPAVVKTVDPAPRHAATVARDVPTGSTHPKPSATAVSARQASGRPAASAPSQPTRSGRPTVLTPQASAGDQVQRRLTAYERRQIGMDPEAENDVEGLPSAKVDPAERGRPSDAVSAYQARQLERLKTSTAMGASNAVPTVSAQPLGVGGRGDEGAPPRIADSRPYTSGAAYNTIDEEVLFSDQ